jgi:MOSC domain-containing protein YiiM
MTKIVSVNVSDIREVHWRGQTMTTGFFKKPVPGADVTRLGLAGDKQAELDVHGGPDKAVYAYSEDHYPWWSQRLPGTDLSYGSFGENLTVNGFNDNEACIGDLYRAGSALLMAVQPRLPCVKLAMRFDDPGLVKTFADSGRLGIYFRVVEEGRINPGDPMEKTFAHPERFPVYELARLYFDPELTSKKAGRALALPVLNDNWRDMLGKRLKKA